MTDDEAEGGRIFFSSTGRSLVDEDEIVVLSVGVDIGSSTSHLVFSRIVLERLDSRYVVTTRETFYESDILLTPYSAEETIDADALGAFIERQYKDAKVDPDEIDTGALILTGVAVRRRNARKIGELFARQAGKMVAVSAGDNLETVMAAYGSGAVARSIREKSTVMNVDIGGGTSKIAVCAEGKVIDLTAIDVGARLVCLDEAGHIVRIEEAARRFAAEVGITLKLGATVVGASQYTTQVSGSTIYVSPMETLPLRNIPVIAPTLALDDEVIDSAAVSSAIKGVLRRLDLGAGDTPVAVFVPWRGSATFQRLHALCEGAVSGLSDILARGHPLVLAGDGDVGGLLGIHLHEEMRLENGVVSVDGLELKDFDYIDIGIMLPSSGAVPVLIKSLIFPTTAATGKDWQPAPRALS